MQSQRQLKLRERSVLRESVSSRSVTARVCGFMIDCSTPAKVETGAGHFVVSPQLTPGWNLLSAGRGLFGVRPTTFFLISSAPV